MRWFLFESANHFLIWDNEKGVRIYKRKIIDLKGQHAYVGILHMIEPALRVCRAIRHTQNALLGQVVIKDL